MCRNTIHHVYVFISAIYSSLCAAKGHMHTSAIMTSDTMHTIIIKIYNVSFLHMKHYFSFYGGVCLCYFYNVKVFIRASVDALCRDGTVQISRERVQRGRLTRQGTRS